MTTKRSLCSPGVKLGPTCWLLLAAMVSGAATSAVWAQTQDRRDAVEAASLVLDLSGHTGPIRRLAVDPRGRVLVTASDDKTAIIWDLAEGRALHVLRVPVASGDVGRLYGAAIDPLGRVVAVAGTTAAPGGSHRIHIFDLETGALARSFDARGGDVKRLAWTLDGNHLAAVYAGASPALRIFDVQGELWAEHPLGADSYGLSTSVQGSMAVSTFDREVRLLRWRAGRLELHGTIRTRARDPVSVRHSPDGLWLAVGYFSPTDDGARRRVVVDVYGVTTRKLERSIEFGDLAAGNLMSVAWQADGQALYAAGTGYARAGEFAVKRIPWPKGEPTSVVVAVDSIQDLAPLPGGGVAFASYDGSWGALDGAGKLAHRHGAPVAQVMQPQRLRVSADARRVAWQRRTGDAGADESVAFSLDERKVVTSLSSVTAGGELIAPVEFEAPNFIVGNVRDGLTPSVNQVPVAMLPNEVARAAALFVDRQSMVLAASRTLRRIGRDGREAWRRMLHTEARAVNVSSDGRLVVAGLGDGSIRWYRASDGEPLLALMVLRDGRWVLWSDDGYFDASPGAQDLVGWLEASSSSSSSSSGQPARLRREADLGERFRRPEVDRVLTQAPRVAGGLAGGVVAPDPVVEGAASERAAPVMRTPGSGR